VLDVTAGAPGAASLSIDPALVARAAGVLAALRARNLTVVTGESCTAGLIAAVLSQAEGAGDVLHGSFVTYSKTSKCAMLGLSAELLRSAGAVNATVAAMMVHGALHNSAGDLALAITGVLGPEPDEDGNPVGLVFLACGERGGTPRILRKDYGAGPHEALRRAAVLDALALLEEYATRPTTSPEQGEDGAVDLDIQSFCRRPT
jgi:nicotinamide-nucleotide amidase